MIDERILIESQCAAGEAFGGFMGDWSKPIVVLIKQVSAAIGALWQPHQIRRVARAEGDAAKIRALAEVEIAAIQQRGSMGPGG